MTAPRLKCDHCAGVIGVYEPVVVVLEGEIRETSLAAEPAIGSELGERFHRACYIERFDPAAA